MADAKIVLSAQDKTSAAFATARRGLAGIGSAAASVQGALSGIGVATAAFALSNMVRQARQTIDGFNDLSDATGSSIENISALDRIARAAGGNFEDLSGILVKFNQVLEGAEAGKGAGAVLESLNLDVAELKRLDPAEALRLTAVAFEGFADNADKARAFQVLFGKSVREAAPFMKDLAEAGKLVGTVTKGASDEVDQFNKQIALIQANADDAGRALGIGLITEINHVIERFKEGQKEGKSFLEFLFASDAELKRKFAQGNGGVEQRIDLVRQIKEAEHSLKRFEEPSLDSPAYNQHLQKRQADLESLRTRLRAIDDAGNPLNQSQAERERLARQNSGEIAKPGLKVTKKENEDPAAKRARDAAERARLDGLREMERTLERIAVLGEAEGRQYQASADAVMESNAALREEVSLIGLGEQGRLLLLQTKEREAIASKELLLIGLQNAGADATTISNLEREIALRRQRVGLLEEQAAGVRAEEKKETDKDLAEQERDAAKRRTETLATSIEDGILNGFRDGKSAADIFLDELKGRFASAVLRPVIEPIAAAGSAAIGSILTGLFRLPSYDGGGYTGPGSRSGGLDGRGGFMAMLHPDETILDHSKGRRAGAQVINITINNTIGNVASQADVEAGMQVVESRIYGALSRSSRYGGAAS